MSCNQTRVSGYLIGLFTVALAIPASAGGLVSETTAFSSGTPPGDHPIVSQDAARILGHVRKALNAIEADDNVRALAEVNVAEETARTAADALPKFPGKERVWLASRKAILKDATQIGTDFWKSTAAIDTLLDPINGDAVTNGKENAVVFAEVEIPLMSTERLLLTARHELENGHAARAERALVMAENNGSFVSSVAIGPLDEAKRALARANQQLANDATTDIQGDLKTAIASFRNAEKRIKRMFHGDTQKLFDETEEMLDSLDDGAALQPGMLTDLWRRTEDLSDRIAHYVTRAWNDREQQSMAFQLSSAKLHVETAEFDQLTAHAPRAAQEELRAAEQCLEQAAHRAPAAKEAAIMSDGKKIGGMIASLSKAREERPTFIQYENVLTDLGNLMRML